MLKEEKDMTVKSVTVSTLMRTVQRFASPTKITHARRQVIKSALTRLLNPNENARKA